nr:hypothetical protein [Tanacetum cinerariifolium]
DADGVECLPNEEIYAELACMGYEKPPPKLTFYKAFFSAQWKFLIHTIVYCLSAKKTAWNEFSSSMASAVICLATDDLTSHTTKYTSPALIQKVFGTIRRIGKVFSGVETLLFDTIWIKPQVQDADDVEKDEDDNEVPIAPTPLSPTPKISPPQQQPALLSSPPQAQLTQPADTSESSMNLLIKLMETCATLNQKEDRKEEEIKAFWFKEVKEGELDADEDVTLVDVDTIVKIDDDTQGRMEEDVTAITEVNVVEPTVFNDEEVTMTMAQTLIQMKTKKARILGEQMAKRLQDEEIDWNVVVGQMQEKHLDNIKKYQSLKRKPISVAQARKNTIVYLKNMVGYKIQYFMGITYDQVRPIFEREYNHIQTFLKFDRDEEPTKKRHAKETLLQESFKKLRIEIEVSGSLSIQQDTPTVDPAETSEEDVQNMLQIVLMVEFKVEALQVKYPLIDWEIYSEGSRTY